MDSTKKQINKSTFSLYETMAPKFHASQIRIDRSKRVSDYGLPKPTRKLSKGRTGKIGYSK